VIVIGRLCDGRVATERRCSGGGHGRYHVHFAKAATGQQQHRLRY